MKTIIVYKDGTYKEVSKGAWEYANDPDWLVSIPMESEWMPVSEGLPEDDTPVLVSIDTAYNRERRSRWVCVQSYCEGEWETQDVIAWQPLPQQYTPQVEGEK